MDPLQQSIEFDLSLAGANRTLKVACLLLLLEQMDRLFESVDAMGSTPGSILSGKIPSGVSVINIQIDESQALLGFPPGTPPRRVYKMNQYPISEFLRKGLRGIVDEMTPSVYFDESIEGCDFRVADNGIFVNDQKVPDSASKRLIRSILRLPIVR